MLEKRKDCTKMFEFIGFNFEASVGPISEKNLLNSEAIFRSPSIIFLFTQNFVN